VPRESKQQSQEQVTACIRMINACHLYFYEILFLFDILGKLIYVSYIKYNIYLY
jgi:hypothetical protein